MTDTMLASEPEVAAATASILIADDDPTQRFLYRRALSAAGFAVIETADGAAAVEAFAALRPALVVLDVMMPGMDGFATCAAIRATAAGETAPILIATSLEDIGSIERAYDAGATDFLAKPINWKILVQRIRYMLRANEALDRLRESERRLAEAQRIAALGNFVWPLGARTIEASDELRRILAVDDDGAPIALRNLLRRLPPVDRCDLLQAVRITAADGSQLERDLVLLMAEEAPRDIHLRGEWTTQDGRRVLQGTVQDVTQRKRIESALVGARRAAESADAVKSSLLAGMNHELRTPLNAIIGFSEIIAGEILGPLGEPRYREFATDILQSGRHMLELVSNVLDMAKLASHDYQPKFEPADLRAIANSTVAMVMQTPSAQGRTIRLVDWDLPIMANVDILAVKQMLVHLLSNALKFSPPETSVTLSCSQRKTGELWVTVTDQGFGMTGDEIESAIEPFRQLDTSLSRKYEGLGIGLSIVKRLIELHGGRLLIASATGEGTKVTLVFPRQIILMGAELMATIASIDS